MPAFVRFMITTPIVAVSSVLKHVIEKDGWSAYSPTVGLLAAPAFRASRAALRMSK